MGLKVQLKRYHNVFTASTLTEGLTILERETSIELVLLDIGLPDGSGIEGLSRIKLSHPNMDVVMVTAVKDPKFVVQAVRRGASDYIVKPYDKDELSALLEKIQYNRSIKNRHDALVAGLNPIDTKSMLLGSSPAFKDLLTQAKRLKGHNANVLVLGESGTGKELLARYIHGLEDSAVKRPFIAVNCAAIPEGLIESELFGHEKGAFTGAIERKIGRFELANGGDIFLDEIGTLKPDLQAKILRVLQEREIVRVGGNTTIHTDFRVIAATNVDIARMVENNQFRVDLYHRIKVVQLVVPPLRERREDIPMLIAYFLERFWKNGEAKKITGQALRKLQDYSWPGNIRELENIVHSLSILTPGGVIEEGHLPQTLNGPVGVSRKSGSPTLPELCTATKYRDYLNRAERVYIEHILDICKGDKTKAAAEMNIGRTTLYSRLKELGIE